MNGKKKTQVDVTVIVLLNTTYLIHNNKNHMICNTNKLQK